jgi:hypothetical protein
VLGDVAGAPGKLPYAEDVYKYMRLLEKASPRVKVFSIGPQEEGREMIAVAWPRRRCWRSSKRIARGLTSWADPRMINMDEAEADRLVDQTFPIYYITGTIHSPETGSPTALMDSRIVSPSMRVLTSNRFASGMVTLITPGSSKSTAAIAWSMFTTGIWRIPDRTGRADLLGTLCCARQQSRCDGPVAETSRATS